MKRNRIVALGLVLLLLTGCGGKSASNSAAPAASVAEQWIETADAAADLPMSTEESMRSQTDSPVYRSAGAKLIRRAELTIQTTQFDQAAAALDRLVTEHGGYYETASVYGGGYRNAHGRRSGEYVVRVPAESYSVFQQVTGELGYVVSSTESSEDVGERYYDTESRLKTQRTKQERLLKLLEQAATMEDIIDLENALSDVELEIEQLSSTLNRYDALISYSTFTIYLEEVTEVNEEVGETASLAQRMGAGLAASGKGLVQGVQDLLVWASYHIFGLLIGGAVLIAGGTAALRLGKKRGLMRAKERNQQAEEE